MNSGFPAVRMVRKSINADIVATSAISFRIRAQGDKMRIHPEVREVLQAEMTEGLRYWRDKSPEEINNRMRARMLAEQTPLCQRNKILTYKVVPRCKCLVACVDHLPWCDGKSDVIFEAKDGAKEIDGRYWYGPNTYIDPNGGY